MVDFLVAYSEEQGLISRLIGRVRVLVCCVFLIATACEDEVRLPELQKIDGEAQGTTYHIVYWGEQAFDQVAMTAKVQLAFEEIDKSLSNYRPDSAIERFNANPSVLSQIVPPELVELVRAGQRMSELSQGCFDLTIKPLFDLWGFSKDQLNIPTQEQLQETMRLVGMNQIVVVDNNHLSKKNPKVRVDVSAVAQGYSVARIAKALENEGVQNYLVEIGGELKTLGRKPDGSAWRIAIEKPLPNQRSLHKVVDMPKEEGLSVMTSGTYRHFFELRGQRYGHILDARKGAPVSHDLVAVTVMHADPVVADAWSTALLCLGQEQGMLLANQEKINALFIRQRGSELLESRSQALSTSKLVKIQ